MSGPAIQPLASIIDSQAPASEAAAAPVATATPSLQAAIDSTTTAVDAGSAIQEIPATQAQQAVLRDLLVKRGLTVPETFVSDDEIADALVAEFDAANASRQTPEYQRYLAWQAQQAVAPVPAPEPPAPAKAQVSEGDLLAAVRTGIVSYDNETKKWSATHPQFGSYAEAMNEQDARANQAKISLASDPESFIRQKIQESISSIKPQGEVAELKELLQQIKQERENAQISQVDSWVAANRDKLFVPNSNTLTPMGQLYQTLESTVDPKVGPLERHNKVLQQWAAFDQVFNKPAAAAAPITTTVTQPKPSFLDLASRRSGTNRLSEYTGPASNAVAPQIPRGKQGMPSLSGLIEQQITLTGN